MIVRILGEGRFDVPESAMAKVEQADGALVEALDAGDESAFDTALDELVDAVRGAGSAVAPDDLATSQLVVPHPGSTLDEVRKLLAGES
ncbi:MAG: PspA-associated protein PspAA [Acidimicrobiales bacterium]